jgi:prepilin-type processing-associated H-X9-DG protein
MLELLVVMVIIFLLAGLSVGGYHKVRAKSNQLTCLSNLKTLAYSMNMYMNDYYGYMVPYVNAQGDRWTTILVENEYLHEGTYFEPAGITEGNARQVGMEPLYCYNDFSDEDVFFQDKYAAGGSYCINRDIVSSATVNRKWSHIQNVHKKILLCDYNQEGIEDSDNFAVSAQMNQNNWQNGGSSGNGTIGRPHFGGTNCLYADWHAGFKHDGTFSDENFSLEMNFN